jgi:hypothetical protein
MFFLAGVHPLVEERSEVTFQIGIKAGLVSGERPRIETP